MRISHCLLVIVIAASLCSIAVGALRLYRLAYVPATPLSILLEAERAEHRAELHRRSTSPAVKSPL